MRTTNDIFIPIPRPRNTQCRVIVNGDDVTSRTLESEWIYPVTSGLGTFKVVLNNAGGQLTNLYVPGQSVKFYADYIDGTTLQFWGRIDFAKDDISEEGHFLELEGRHRSFLLNEFLICHSATEQSTSTILSAIIDKLPSGYGFTKTNVLSSSDTMSVEWNYKPFWECVVELCNFSNFDCYVDNDLDFHYFPEDSILNEYDAISEGDTFISTQGFGTNNYYEKTRVVATGQDKEGNPIIYTAISDTEGSDVREVFVRDSSADTKDKVINLAESKLSEIVNRRPQANILSHGLSTLKPGENLWIVVPRQKLAGQYKAIEIKHRFGMKVGGWRTESTIEEQDKGTSGAIQEINKKASSTSQTSNPNKLNYSFNLSFDSDSGTHTDTRITNSKLILNDSTDTTGTWISQTEVAPSNVNQVEMRIIGKDIWGSEFYFSLDAGVTYQQIAVDNLSTLVTAGNPGNNIRIKVVLIKPTGWDSLNPEIDSLVLLYS